VAVLLLTAGIASAVSLARSGSSGDQGDPLRFTVIEGLTINQILEWLAGETTYDREQLGTALLDGSVTSRLLPAPPRTLRDWEGLLFPDTYQVDQDATPAQILQLLADTAAARVESIDWSHLDAFGLTPYDGIVIASMIEREAATAVDRPLISSVIFNRLEIGMRLQIDATVVYALGGYPEGGLTYTDLEIDSPYNTYRIDALPPTPIAAPGLASLQAAAAPADTGYFFYVLADEDGNHAFAATYDEFLVLVEQSRERGLIP
jgi:UPF0755 protein